MNWKVFFKTLGMAAMGGATSGALAALAAGTVSPKALGTSVATGALVAVGAYLKKSPLPEGSIYPTPQDPPKTPLGK